MEKNIKEFKNCLQVLRYLQDHKNDESQEDRRIYFVENGLNFKTHYLEYDVNTDYIKEVKEYNHSLLLDYINKVLK